MTKVLMSDPIQIDGSQGEGGGQIVRSSLALSMVTGQAVTIANIRAGRPKPGLMRQHLTAVNAAVEISGGKVTGAEIGSRQLTFEPGSVRPGAYRFSIGTAGSTTLVLQTVLPALLCADAPSTLILEGGTHNQWAPPFDFLQRSFLPLINRMGPRVTATLDRHGFHPGGGGRFTLEIIPAPALAGFDLVERGETISRSVRALVSNLPAHIGEREVDTVIRKLNWSRQDGGVHDVPAHGPGNIVFIELECAHVTEVFVGFGRVGITAENVARDVVRQCRDYLAAEVPVGGYLADQILLPLAISAWQSGDAGRQRGGSFKTLPLTRHSTTHIEILRKFLDIDVVVELSTEGRHCQIRIGAMGN